MKNQFFGDKRDYFKYDLWLELAEKMNGIKSLTFIPMLTRNDSTKEGRKVSYSEGKRRKRLYGFLQFCLAPERRSITRLREFLCDESFEYHPYRDEDDKGFQDGSWDAYFSAIPREWLRDAAILVDPDVGLETKTDFWKTQPEKYVTCEQIEKVVSRSCQSSVFLLFQFLQKKADLRLRDLKERRGRLHKVLSNLHSWGNSVYWLSERAGRGLGDLAFLVWGSDPKADARLRPVLRDYARKHSLRFGGS